MMTSRALDLVDRVISGDGPEEGDGLRAGERGVGSARDNLLRLWDTQKSSARSPQAANTLSPKAPSPWRIARCCAVPWAALFLARHLVCAAHSWKQPAVERMAAPNRACATVRLARARLLAMALQACKVRRVSICSLRCTRSLTCSVYARAWAHIDSRRR